MINVNHREIDGKRDALYCLHTLCDDKIAEIVPQKQSKNRQKQTNKQTQGVTTAL